MHEPFHYSFLSKEKIRVALYVQKAALQFIDAGGRPEDVRSPTAYTESIDSRHTGFGIGPDELASIIRERKVLRKHGGIEGIARRLSVSLDKGASAYERPNLDERKEYYGSNQFEEKPGKSFWIFLWEAHQDRTLIVLGFCAVVCIGLGVSTTGWPEGVYEGLGIMLSIFLVVAITAVSDFKQYLLFRDLTSEKKKVSVQVTRDGKRKSLSIYNLVVGDIVHLFTGDQVPADGLFISGCSLLIDESSLTGESEPLNIDGKRPYLCSGTKVQDGSGEMLVTSVGMRTEWGKLMESLSEWGEDETPLQVKLNGVATIVGKIGLVFSLLVFMILTSRFLFEKALSNDFLAWSSRDALELLNYVALAVTIYMGAVPEGLPLAVTLSLAFAMGKLMHEKALVRHPSACETMGSVSCICTDKTGTLTTNHMRVNRIWICDNIIDSNDTINNLKSAISDRVLYIVLQSLFKNTSAEVVEGEDGKRITLGSPTESALLEYGSLLGADIDAKFWEAKRIKVVPFNSVRKKMSVLVVHPNGGMRALCKGAAEIILGMCDKVLDCNGESSCLSREKRTEIMNIIDGFSTEALRTLCLAFYDITHALTEDTIPDSGYTLLAVIGIRNPVRPGVKDAVQACLTAGIAVRMVTGDNINTAKAVARECGILTDEGLAIEGPDFRSRSPLELKEMIPRIQVMACSLPLDKYMLVNNLKRMFGEVVAVTGDGTNDAPALREANVGLAMNLAGTEVAKQSGDVIIMDDNFTTIVNLIKWGRSVYVNVQNFLQFQLTVNIVALLLNFVSACISGSTPITPVQLLWINMIMDILGALALATEPARGTVMQRPPIGRHRSLITSNMWWNIVGQSIYQLATLLIFKFNGENLLKLNGSDAGSVLDTFIFNTFVFCQVFNEINSREAEKLNVFGGISRSWLFLTVIGIIVAFQVVLVEFLGFLANTVPLGWQLWLLSVSIGCASLVVAVLLKCAKPIKHVEAINHCNDYDLLPNGPELI